MRHLPGVLLRMLAVAAVASGQTAEELVARNLQAKGGLEKIKAIKTIRMTGRLQQGDFVATTGEEGLGDLQGMVFVVATGGAALLVSDQPVGIRDEGGGVLHHVVHDGAVLSRVRLQVRYRPAPDLAVGLGDHGR